MQTENKLKVGQVGVANFGATRRSRMRQTGLYDVIAVHDRNPEAQARAAVEEDARACDSFEELLDTPGLEAVIISTGGKYHAEQGLAAMDRGYHVLIEKPLCSTPEEMCALLEAQRRNGVVAATGHADHSSDALSLTIKGMIDRGELGTVAAFEKTTCHSGGLQIKPGDWRGDPEKNPGGMLFQCGVHALHEMMFYFGPISEVAAQMRYDVHTTGTADVAQCLLKFESGLLGSLNAYHVSPYRHTLNIFGTEANLYRDERFFSEGTHLVRQRRGKDNGPEPHEVITIEGESDSAGEVRSFFRAIRHGEKLYPSLRDGALAVAAVFAAEDSARQGGCPVKLPSV